MKKRSVQVFTLLEVVISASPCLVLKRNIIVTTHNHCQIQGTNVWRDVDHITIIRVR